MSTTYIFANWKSNKSPAQAQDWLSQFQSLYKIHKDSLVTAVCAPFSVLETVKQFITSQQLPLKIGTQNVSRFGPGEHTGEISASMLVELASFCIVGHSERRRQQAETSSQVVQKSQLLLESSISPIICLDEPYLEEQVSLLVKSDIDLARCLFVYEPLAAIGSGHPVDPSQAEAVCSKIASLTNQVSPILYGGSVNADNISSFVAQEHVSGALIGTASLNPGDFAAIINVL